VLPNYHTCIDRIKAYTQTADYKRKVRKIEHSLLPPKVGFLDFWKYKQDIENKGHSILEEDNLQKTASQLREFLILWKMGRRGIAEAYQIEELLRNIRPFYDEIRSVKLGNGEMCHYRKQLEAIYKGLDGITNRKDYPDGSKSYITGKSKTLLAIWGQTPGFDSLTRKRFVKWTHPPEPRTLPHLRSGGIWYEPSQYCDMLVALDDWVYRWSESNNGRIFADSFSNLCPGLPVGRIIDEIYNWDFEYEPLKHYLFYVEKLSQKEALLSFKKVEAVIGFDLCQPAYKDCQWWESNIARPLRRSQSQRRRKGKPWWKMVRVDIEKQEVVFALQGHHRGRTTVSIGAGGLSPNSKEVKKMNEEQKGGEMDGGTKSLPLERAEKFAYEKNLNKEAEYIKRLRKWGARDALREGLFMKTFQRDEDKGYWDEFKRQFWPHGDTNDGKARISEYEKLVKGFLDYLRDVAAGQRPYNELGLSDETASLAQVQTVSVGSNLGNDVAQLKDEARRLDIDVSTLVQIQILKRINQLHKG